MKQHTKEELDTVSKSVSAVIFADFQLYLQEVTSAPKSDTMMKPTAQDLAAYLESLRNEEQRQQLMRFFKTGKGDYGEGDEFLGLKVPQTREVVKLAKDLPLEEIPALLVNRWHEVRLCRFLLLVDRFEKLCTKKLEHDETAMEKRDRIVGLYLEYADYANNWDLVDLSAPRIIGRWLTLPTRMGELSWCLRYAEMHLHHLTLCH